MAASLATVGRGRHRRDPHHDRWLDRQAHRHHRSAGRSRRRRRTTRPQRCPHDLRGRSLPSSTASCVDGRWRRAERRRPADHRRASPALNPNPRPTGIDERTHSSAVAPAAAERAIAGWRSSSARCRFVGRFTDADLGGASRAPSRACRTPDQGWPTTPALGRRSRRRSSLRTRPRRRRGWPSRLAGVDRCFGRRHSSSSVVAGPGHDQRRTGVEHDDVAVRARAPAHHPTHDFGVVRAGRHRPTARASRAPDRAPPGRR